MVIKCKTVFFGRNINKLYLLRTRYTVGTTGTHERPRGDIW